jgi:cysteine synthase B
LNTPLVEATNLVQNKNVKLLLKLEGNNPGGGKDRAAHDRCCHRTRDIKRTKLIEATVATPELLWQ